MKEYNYLKFNNKKIIIPLIAFIITILLVTVLIFNKDKIEKVVKNILKIEVNEFTYSLYSNENDIWRVIVEIANEEGINEIIYPNNERILYCNGKEKIAIDYIIRKDEEYTFTSKNTKGEIKEYKFCIDQNYIDSLLKIEVSSEKEIGTQATINITFGEQRAKNEYAIGKNNINWASYQNEFIADSYTIIQNNWGNEDYTTTIKARIVDDAGCIVEIEKQITCLDIDAPTEPIIIADSNGKYPILTLNDAHLVADVEINFDNRKDITNYYSVDNGKTWQEYIEPKQEITKGNVIAKSIKNTSGLEIIKNVDVTVPDDAILKEAYDGDENTVLNVYAGGYGTSRYYKIKIVPEIYEKAIEINGVFSANYNNTVLVTFYDANNEKIKDIAYNENIDMPKIEVTEDTVYVGFAHSGYHGTASIREVNITDRKPEITIKERDLLVLTNQGIVDNTEKTKATIKYFNSTQKLYRIDDGDWQEYNNEGITLEPGQTIYAKGIFEDLSESEVVSQKSPILSLLGKEAYDGDESTYFNYYGDATYYIKIDPSVLNRNIKVNIVSTGDTYCFGIMSFILEDGSEVEFVRVAYSSFNSTVKIPENAVRIKYFTQAVVNLYEIGLAD